MQIYHLSDAISAVCPIEGVSVGTWDNKATWRIDFAPSALPEERAAAEAVVADFDPNQTFPEYVTDERNRRLKTVTYNGVVFDFCDGKGSDVNIAGAGTMALSAILAGAQSGDLRWFAPDRDFVWIAADNTLVPMDAQTTLAFAKHAGTWKESLIRAARVLKDQNPIPLDYQSNAYWPQE